MSISELNFMTAGWSFAVCAVMTATNRPADGAVLFFALGILNLWIAIRWRRHA